MGVLSMVFSTAVSVIIVLLAITFFYGMSFIAGIIMLLALIFTVPKLQNKAESIIGKSLSFTLRSFFVFSILIVGVYKFGNDQQAIEDQVKFDAAEKGGFSNTEVYLQSVNRGIYDYSEYKAVVSQEKTAAIKAVAIAKQNKERVVAAEKAAACRVDLKCWAQDNYMEALSVCLPLVERSANYDIEWIEGLMGLKFPSNVWIDQAAGTLVYAGDKVKFQNGFGAWSVMRYWCEYDPTNKKSTKFVIEKGRI